MRITTHTDGDIFLIALQGKIMGEPETDEIVDTVKAALYDNKSKLVMDMGGVDWINSSGLGALIAAQGLLRDMKGELRLAAVNDSVMSVLKVNKLNLIFEIHPTVRAATASFQ